MPELIVENSELPKLESILRSLDLTPKEADAALESARTDRGVSLKRLISDLVSARGAKFRAESSANVERLVRLLEAAGSGELKSPAGSKGPEIGERIAKLESILRSLDLTPKEAAGSKGSEAGSGITRLESGLQVLEDVGNAGRKLPDKGLFEHRPAEPERLFQELNPKMAAASESPAKTAADDIRVLIKKLAARAVLDEGEERPGLLAESLKKAKTINLLAKGRNARSGPGSKVEVPAADAEVKESFQVLDRVLKAKGRIGPEPVDVSGKADEPRGAKRVAAGKAPSGPADFSSLRSFASGLHSKQPPVAAREFVPGHVIGQVGKQLSRGIVRGDRVITLRLEPPDLGTLRIEMDVKENIVKLGMVTNNHVSREILLSNVPELRDALAEQGLKLAGMNVRLDEDSGHSLAHGRNGGEQDRNPSEKWDENLYFADEADAERAAGEAVLAGSGLLDLVA
jgi:hypothetical protein